MRSRLTQAAAWTLGVAITALSVAIPAPAVAAPNDQPESGGVLVQLLEAPVALKEDPRAQNYIVDNLPPGTEITRKIRVTNTGTIAGEVSLYPGAASIPEGRGFSVEEGAAVNELTTWMSVTPDKAHLDPGESTEVTAAIDVPADAPEGEQYAVVWAQIGDPARNSSDDGTVVNMVSRAGIRVYLSVGPGNGPPAAFDIGQLVGSRDESGAPTVTATVRNTGGRAIDPSGTLTLKDGPGGISTSPAQAAGASIAPGQSGTVTFTLDPAIPAGPWQAEVELKSGVLTHSTGGSLTFPDEGSVTATGDSRDDSGGIPAWGWAAIGGGAALVIGVIAATVLVRRNKAV